MKSKLYFSNPGKSLVSTKTRGLINLVSIPEFFVLWKNIFCVKISAHDFEHTISIKSYISLSRSYLCWYPQIEVYNICDMLFVIIDITSRRDSSTRMNYSKNFPAREREKMPSTPRLRVVSHGFYTIPVLYHISDTTNVFIYSGRVVLRGRARARKALLTFTASYCIYDRAYDRFSLVEWLAIIIIS